MKKTTEPQSLLFGYPDLPLHEKVEFEKAILKAPYSLEVDELSHLLAVGFPFNKFHLRWLTKYEQLALWVQKEGDFPTREVEIIGPWVHMQRHLKRTGKLPVDREMALNRIHFIWEPEDHWWQQQYELFIRSVKDQVPLSVNLRAWMSKTRARWSRLSSHQRRLLREAGFVRKPQDQRAQTNLAELEVIFEKQGNIEGLVIRLSHFVRRLRLLQEMGKLDAETKARCDRIGFVWTTYTAQEQEEDWNKRYAEVQEYVQQFRGVIPPSKQWENRKLGQWVKNQTRRWKTMTPERQQLLIKAGVVLKHGQQWEIHYQKALALFRKLGPYRGKAYQDEDAHLKRWIAGQRLIWGDLTPTQQEKLQAIGLKKNDGKMGSLRRVRNVLKALGGSG